MKKVLIITYYWPPKGGVGVQRWLKLTKYLYKYNYKPIIYTPENGTTPLSDKSLLDSVPLELKVLKNRIFEPQALFPFLGKRSPDSDVLIKKNNSFLNKFLIWFRANFFIPDSRCLWIKPSIKFLLKYLKTNPVDIIISTGPPHSMHMIALSLKKKLNIKWIADFRDPWTDIEYFDHLPLLSLVRKKHQTLEKEVLSHVDLALSVSPSWAHNISMLGAKKVEVLTNGYDPDDYCFESSNDDREKFRIGHFGLYNELRDHSFFWKTIQKICLDNLMFAHSLSFLFAGEVHDQFFPNLKNFQLDKKTDYYKYLKHHESIEKMMQCDLLLVTQGHTKSVKGRLPAKFFEYLGSRKPILAIGKKNSDLEQIIAQVSYAWFVDFENDKLLYDTILHIYELSKKDNKFHDDISEFSREYHAKKIIQLINTL